MPAIVRNALKEWYSPERKILVDANVWVFIEDQQASQNDPGYARLMYFHLLKYSAQLFTTPVMLEEYINVRIRTSYTRYTKRMGYDKQSFDFKHDYCSTDDFHDEYQMILDEVQTDILPNVTVIDSAKDVIEKALVSRKSFDFNDEMIIQCAKKNHFDILTNDYDFDKNADDVTVLHCYPG